MVCVRVYVVVCCNSENNHKNLANRLQGCPHVCGGGLKETSFPATVRKGPGKEVK